MTHDERAGSDTAGRNEKTVESDGASYNRDDIASREEFDGRDYYEYPPGTRTKHQMIAHLIRQLGRARIPELDDEPEKIVDTLSKISRYGEILINLMFEEGMSKKQVKKVLKAKFAGLTERYNEFYRMRFENAKTICRGIALSELDAIKDGTWEANNMKKARQWADVSVNKEVAKKFAFEAVDLEQIGVLLEIDMESVMDQLVSPGYVPDRIEKTTKIDEPDGIFRGLANEEHHLPPDIDLRRARVKVIIYNERTDNEEIREKFKNIGENWTVEIR